MSLIHEDDPPLVPAIALVVIGIAVVLLLVFGGR